MIFKRSSNPGKSKNNKSFEYVKDIESKYESLLENVKYGQQISRTGSWTHNIKTDEIFFTDEVYSILEVTPEDFDGKLDNFYSLIHPDDLENVKKATQEAIQGIEYDLEYRIITRNGTEKYVHERTKALFDHTYNPVKMVGIIQDITAHKLIEHDLKALGDYYNHAQRVAGVGSWKYDIQKDEFYGTDEMFKIYGISRSEFNNDFQNTIQLVHPEDRVKVQDAMNRHFSGQSATVEYRIPQKNGTYKFVIGKGEPIFNEEGQVVGILGTLQDITRKKLLEQELQRSYKIINQVEALAHIGSWEYDVVNSKFYLSDEACRIFNINSGENNHSDNEIIKHMHPDQIVKYIHPDDITDIIRIFDNPPNKPVELEFRIVHDDGSIRYIQELVEFVFNKDEKLEYVYGTIQDITDKKELQKEVELKQQKINKMQRKFTTLIKESIDVFEILDADGRIVYISEASEKVVGYKAEERLGKIVYEFYDENERRILAEMIEYVKSSYGNKIKKDVMLTRKDGKRIYLEIFMQNFFNDPAIEGIVVNFRDITDRVENEIRITKLSTHDQLTDLPNKLHFENKVKELIHNSKGNNEFAIFMLDVDSQRSIKNALGYKIVEQYIKQIALKLKSFCASTKYLCRYSDNRFIIIVYGMHNIDEYEKVVKNIYNLFSNSIKVNEYELDVEISIGINVVCEDAKDIEMLVRNTETALFLAKSEGRNKYKFYSSEINIQNYKYFALRNDLKRSIENNQLKLYYQPIVNLGTAGIIAAEALLRWEHPDWGVVYPNEFISIAKETGYIIKMGDWLLREICENYRQWKNNGLPKIMVSVNFSVMQFLDSDFVANVKNIIDKYELDPHFLIIEITESVLIDRTDKLISDIKKLQSYGIQIALDDFGTGYSSLTYLASLNIDIIKIDGSFIKNINVKKSSTVLTQYLIKIAQELKIKVVAKHIETLEQLEFLRSFNCYAGQGYLFCKPATLNDFEKILSFKECKVAKPDNNDDFSERRKYFRVKFTNLLEGDLTIVEIKGRKVNVGNTKILIKDIGPGGLCFISNLKLPVDREIIFQFTTQLIGEEIKACGCTVWTKEIDNGLSEYGIEFIIDDNKRSELVRVLSQVQIRMRNDIVFKDGKFINDEPYEFFKK